MTDEWTGQILAQYRRVLSCVFVRAQANCLVARMGHLGEAAKESAARRHITMADDERRKKEQEAYFAAHIRGRGRWAGR